MILMQISIIVAMDRNRVIGKKGALPWHLSADLKHFKATTMGKPIVMGRKTYESIAHPLAGRENIVLTHDITYQAEGCTVLHHFDELYDHCKDCKEVMITGGSAIYATALDKATRIYLTEVQTAIEGDTRFPDYDRSRWHEISRQDYKADANNDFDYSFLVLERND